MVLGPAGDGTLEFERARRALSMENTVAALASLERALRIEDNPSWYSYLGYCIARERGLVAKGVELCMISLEHDPDNHAHYLNLGKVHLLSGNKAEAIGAFREGMSRGGGEALLEKLEEFGMRKPPVFTFLSRSNPLNRYPGLFLRRIGLR